VTLRWLPLARTSRGLDRSSSWVLNPSDFAFLWDECHRCFYRKCKLRQRRPAAPFPKIFSIIDREMKRFYLGERLEDLADGAPSGVIGLPDQWVKSAPLSIPGSPSTVVIQGRVDALVRYEDGTVGVIDLKTADPNIDHVAKYSRQLHAYAAAFEQPSGGPSVRVSTLGLLCFSPRGFDVHRGEAALLGGVCWINIPRDDAAFSEFLSEMGSVLDQESLPPPALDCSFCAAEDRLASCAA
jgi:PD-(D/E)XK nuclease superfamily